MLFIAKTKPLAQQSGLCSFWPHSNRSLAARRLLSSATMMVLVHLGTETVFDLRCLNRSVSSQALRPSLSDSRAPGVVFLSKDSTLGHPLVLRNVDLVSDELALPDTREGKVPEIAVDELLKASANNKHFLGSLQIRPQPV